jgi:phage N-6-adenine-methyltransferase
VDVPSFNTMTTVRTISLNKRNSRHNEVPKSPPDAMNNIELKGVAQSGQENSNSRLTKGMFTSRTDDWSTPQDAFDQLNTEFQFTLDVCASSKNAKCERYYTKEHNGLEQNWSRERCFMNPPYGDHISDWMEKAYKESRRGALVVCLVPTRTDTRWWHDWAMKADEIRFVKGRIKFGNGKQSAPFPSCVIVFRPRANDYSTIVVRPCKFKKEKGARYKPIKDLIDNDKYKQFKESVQS